MKFYKVGTEVRVLGDFGFGNRVKHGIVTTVNDQNSLMVRIGRDAPRLVRRVGARQFEAPSGSARPAVISAVGSASGSVA